MLRGLLSMFLVGRMFRMFSGRSHRGYAHHRSSGWGGSGWGSRRGYSGHSSLSNLLGSLGGFHRRRRSFI